MTEGIFFIVGSYLWGSLPSAYLVSRYCRGIDIRQYGSGNVGAANVMTHIGIRTGWLLGTFDCLAKGTLPIVLANLLDQSYAVQSGIGIAAIAGHNWSLYIRFTGGRGVATAIGVVLGSLMWPEALILAVVLGGCGQLIFREMGFWTFISMLLLPVLAFLFDRPPEILYMTLAIIGLLITKRLTANWQPPSREYPLIIVMACRVLWDRDVPKKANWTKRQPLLKEEGNAGDVENKILS